MAAIIYPTAKKFLLDGNIDFLNDNIKMLLVSATYTYSAAHDFHADITGIIATSANITGKTVTLVGTKQVVDFDDVVFSAVAGGSTITGIVLYRDSGVSGTSELILYDAVASTPTNGGDITITVPVGTDKAFSID